MKTSPNPVPHGQGVYALLHRDTKSVYIGSSTYLRGRAAEWRYSLKRRADRLKKADFPEHPVEEWEFKVLKQTDGLSAPELRALEAEAIEAAKHNRVMKVLNRQPPSTQQNFTVSGMTGSLMFHASRLGLNPSRVQKKLHKGRTIEQALGLAPVDYDPRQQTLSMMPITIRHQGEALTYSEASAALGMAVDSLKEKIKRRRSANPNMKELELEALR